MRVDSTFGRRAYRSMCADCWQGPGQMDTTFQSPQEECVQTRMLREEIEKLKLEGVNAVSLLTFSSIIGCSESRIEQTKCSSAWARTIQLRRRKMTSSLRKWRISYWHRYSEECESGCIKCPTRICTSDVTKSGKYLVDLVTLLASLPLVVFVTFTKSVW